MNRDDAKIRAQWAIGQAINLASVKCKKEDITMKIVTEYAKELFVAVSKVQGVPDTPEVERAGMQYIDNFGREAKG
jgi:hypothetical protein